VILATGFIHLLEPAADDELGPANTYSLGGCISDSWADYPYAFGICLTSLFCIFVIELIAFRIGTAKLAAIGIKDGHAYTQPGGQGLAHPHVHGDDQEHANRRSTQIENIEIDPNTQPRKDKVELHKDLNADDYYTDSSEASPAAAQIIGVAVLEFGVVLHSLIIGLTLATSAPNQFTTLFIVIIFHQMFEGLGLGTRLAFLKLPKAWSWAPFAGALLYSCITPLGMAIGVGVRSSLSMTAGRASIVAGILDSISAGVLIYTATVELIAHEFIFNTYYYTCSWQKLTFVISCFAAGAGIMALLGKWA